MEISDEIKRDIDEETLSEIKGIIAEDPSVISKRRNKNLQVYVCGTSDKFSGQGQNRDGN